MNLVYSVFHTCHREYVRLEKFAFTIAAYPVCKRTNNRIPEFSLSNREFFRQNLEKYIFSGFGKGSHKWTCIYRQKNPSCRLSGVYKDK